MQGSREAKTTEAEQSAVAVELSGGGLLTGVHANQDTADSAVIEPSPGHKVEDLELDLTFKWQERRSLHVDIEIEKTAMVRLKERYPELEETKYETIMDNPEVAAGALEIVLEPLRDTMRWPLKEEFKSFHRLVELCTRHQKLREWLWEGAFFRNFDFVRTRALWYNME
ncbi:hypothetical protein BV20DRAFT_975853 [Pilatotrama ljubarskyi]|nr:hypothetical protein BV20DRAFT_975853 [Pilatotrama ljubarskyi]